MFVEPVVLAPLLYIFLCGLAVFWFLWSVQLITRNASFVDVAWALGTGLTTLVMAVIYGRESERVLMILSVHGLWSMRLGFYLMRRLWNQPEDHRYARLRQEWGAQAPWRFFVVFTMNAILVFVLGSSILPGLLNQHPITGWDWLALAIGLVAIWCEAQADYQMKAFRATHPSPQSVLTTGWWRYSQHPNYFFEWLHWWSYVLFGLTNSHWWWAFVGPLIMYMLLRYVTGVPYAKPSLVRQNTAEYQAYIAITNEFFVGPQRDQSTMGEK